LKLLTRQKLCLHLDHYHYQDIEIYFDYIIRRSLKNNNVMGIFDEEQILAWELYNQELKGTARNIDGKVDFLEVGCGSGLWSILFKKHIGGTVLSIDKNQRAVKLTKINTLENNVNIKIRYEAYNLATANYQSVKTIFLNPPFHIYPPEIENSVPLYARGGFDGQREFKNQLLLADYHLSEGGIIIFIMMCIGDSNVPEYCKYIQKIMDQNTSIYYLNVFEPIKSKIFLDSVYDNKYQHFIDKISRDYPYLFYTNGIIKKDDKGVIQNIRRELDIRGKSWNDRIEIHKKINKI